MPIELRVCDDSKEIDNCLWVRHEVFVVEDGKFGGKPLPTERLVDRFDAFPNVHNVIAYEDGEPIATMRLVRESKVGLPADDLFDFSVYKKRLLEKAERAEREGADELVKQPVFGSAGMLAVRANWRRRRDVIRAMFRMAATVCRANGATHVLLVVNHDTSGMYRRLGFSALAEKFWSEEIGNYLTPLVAPTDHFFAWAFGSLPETPLSAFRDSFNRLVLRAGETVFHEGEPGEHAYIVEAGDVRISRHSGTGEELSLAHLGRGSLFGEFALIDELPRSASAVAVVDTELMSLDRKTFLGQLRQYPERANDLFKMFSGRMRSMDELAMVLAFSPTSERLDFAIDLVRQRAVHDTAYPGRRIFRGGPAEVARLAAVDEAEVHNYLAELAKAGKVSFSDRQIVFEAPGDEIDDLIKSTG